MTTGSDPVRNVSRETFERFELFEALLRRWTKKINLVGGSTLETFWERHILDSLALWDEVGPVSRWVDLGAGGGLPIIPVAIMALESNATTRFIAVESDQRKAVFLREVARETGVQLTVVAERIETTAALDADVISARALADIDTILSYAERHCAQNGRVVLLKGESVHGELTSAAKVWQINYQNQRHPLTDRGHILRIDHFARS